MIETPLHVLGVIGSPRGESVSARLVETVLNDAAGRGAETRLFDLRKSPLPLYDLEGDVTSAVVDDAAAGILWADTFVLGSPDYHGAPSGILKNFLDHFWKEFAGKLFGIVVASHEKGLTVHDQLRTSIRQCYGWSLPYGASASDSAVGDDGSVTDATVRRRLAMMARDLLVYGAILRDQRVHDLAAPRDPLEAGFMARMHLD